MEAPRNNLSDQPVLPWYHHRWPWLLISGPAIVIVASMVTLWLAIKSSDGLVTEDYYKKGLAINQTLALTGRAQQLELEAGVSLKLDSINVRLSSKQTSFVPPPQIRVTVSHPTRAGLDQSQILSLAEGRYSGKFRLPATGHWVVLLEDDARTWRMLGNIMLPAAGETVIGSRPEAAHPAGLPSRANGSDVK
ncbi:MAG: FixH family protein [Betaproteobacteria bacterium]|nr:FixH family protein [Betaproteobacteria bacterium]